MTMQLKEWLRRLRRRLPRPIEQKDLEANPKQRRHIVRWLIVLIVLIAAYPVLGTLALWTGLIERIVKSEDLRVEISNPAWTLWPGRIHMAAARILVNGETQFTLQGDNLTLKVDLLRLFKRHFHVTELKAGDVRYRMRVQVERTEGIEQRLAAYPPLDDLPGDATILKAKAQKTEERESDWVVQIEGIDVRVVELWFLEYRFVGDGTLTGGFLVGKNAMRVETSVQDLGPGELRFGPKQTIATSFRGTVAAEIPTVDPEKHADESFLSFVTAHLKLKADVQTLKHVDAYLDGMNVRDGAGPVQIDVVLRKGHVGKGSNLSYKTDSVRLLGDGFGVETDWNLSMRTVAAADAHLPRFESRADRTYVSFSRRRESDEPKSENPFTLRLDEHEQHAMLASTSLAEPGRIKEARLRFPEIVTQDLDDLDVFSRDGSPWQTRAGRARGELDLKMDEERILRGPLRVKFENTNFEVAGVELGGDGSARARASIDLKHETARLDDIEVLLSDFEMHVGDEHVEDWWMKLTADRLHAWGLPPKRTESSFSIRAKDAEPLLEALAEKNKLNDLVAKFTSLDDLTVEGRLRTGEKMTDLMLKTAESDVWDVSGRIYTKGDDSRSALLIGGRLFSVGVATEGSKSEIELQAGTDWLNEKLRKFPKPVEQVKPPKP